MRTKKCARKAYYAGMRYARRYGDLTAIILLEDVCEKRDRVFARRMHRNSELRGLQKNETLILELRPAIERSKEAGWVGDSGTTENVAVYVEHQLIMRGLSK